MVFGVSLETGHEDNVAVLESGQKESRGNADDVGVAVVFVGDQSGLPAAQGDGLVSPRTQEVGHGNGGDDLAAGHEEIELAGVDVGMNAADGPD